MDTTTRSPDPSTAPVDLDPSADAAAPLDADWREREAAAKGDANPGSRTTDKAERREPGHIDSALESLGEAISDPVREAAEEVSNGTTPKANTRPAR